MERGFCALSAEHYSWAARARAMSFHDNWKEDIWCVVEEKDLVRGGRVAWWKRKIWCVVEEKDIWCVVHFEKYNTLLKERPAKQEKDTRTHYGESLA